MLEGDTAETVSDVKLDQEGQSDEVSIMTRYFHVIVFYFICILLYKQVKEIQV